MVACIRHTQIQASQYSIMKGQELMNPLTNLGALERRRVSGVGESVFSKGPLRTD